MPYRLTHKHGKGNLLIAELPLNPKETVLIYYRDSDRAEQFIEAWNPPGFGPEGVVINHRLAIIPVLASLPFEVKQVIIEHTGKLLAQEGRSVEKCWPVCHTIIIGRPLQIKLPPDGDGAKRITLGPVTKLRLSNGARLRGDTQQPRR